MNDNSGQSELGVDAGPRRRGSRRSDAVIALAIAAVVAVTLYFAFGMPGMDHGTSPPTIAHDHSSAMSLVDPAEFEARMNDRDSFVVNVHTPYDGEIADTDAFIAYDAIAEATDRLPTDLSTPILVYCRSGTMSRIASQSLAELGYVDVVELDGGMEAWASSGRPIMSDP